MIAWDAELHLLEKLKQHKLIDQSEPIWAVTYGSSLSVSCAITHWLPTFQENPKKITIITKLSCRGVLFEYYRPVFQFVEQ